jgi:hypothetical protein
MFGVILMIALIVVYISDVGPGTIGFKALLIMSMFVIGIGIIESMTKRLWLTDKSLHGRCWIFQERVIPYENIKRIYFRNDSIFCAISDSGRKIKMPAKAPGIKELIQVLSERVTNIRKLEIVGDLEEDGEE